MRIYPKGVTPERFYRGSSPSFVWIPDRSIRVSHKTLADPSEALWRK